MKVKVIYIEQEKAKRINELLMAEKEFLAENNPSNLKIEKVMKKGLDFKHR
jgi:hypothetical protein